LDIQSVDGATSRQQDSEMTGVACLARKDGGKQMPLLEAIIEFLNEIQPPEVVAVFSHQVERVQWVLENNGDSYHE
jgi:hypothetical protein